MTDAVAATPRKILIGRQEAHELADGAWLVVADDQHRMVLASHHVAGLGQVVWMARSQGVPVLILEAGDLLDLVRRRPVAAEKFGCRYQIEVSDVEEDDWDGDDED